MEVKKDILWRVYLVYLGIVLFCIMILGKIFYIQSFEGAYWRSMADSLHQKIVETEAERGTIYSEDGSMLSTSIPYFDLYMDFGAEGLRAKNGKKFFENVDSLGICLAALFNDRSADDYKKELKQAYKEKNRYYQIKKNISFEQYKLVREFPLIRLGRNKSGFIAEVKDKRLNPFKLLANRTIGLARENSQNVGLERTYDSSLRGEKGHKLVRYLSGGVYVPVDDYEVEPEHGKDIITTLDVNIQDIAENALYRMVKGNDAQHGCCIVMEVKTGKIKAMANLGKVGDSLYWEDLNYAIQKAEPGSTFKLATMISLLEDKFVTINDHVNLNGGTYQYGRRTMFDSEKHGLFDVTVKQAFEHSSNVGMSRLVYQYYSQDPLKYVNHLRRLGLDKKTGVDLVGEGQPTIKTPANKSWSNTTLPWMSVGYEVEVSPLQTAVMYNAIANNGKLMKPYLVNSINDGGVVIKQFGPTVKEEKICSDETLKQIKECLEGVVTEGTARRINNPLYKIAGKTGTSLVADGKLGYAAHIYMSSFAGYFPADDPQYTIVVVIKNKQHAAKFYGADVAAPVFKEISDKLYAMYVAKQKKYIPVPLIDSSMFWYAGYASDIRKVYNTIGVGIIDSVGQNKWMYVNNQHYNPTAKPIITYPQKMPNLSGMGLKDVLFMLENMGLKVNAQGRGKVITQSVEPGSIINKGMLVSVTLN